MAIINRHLLLCLIWNFVVYILPFKENMIWQGFYFLFLIEGKKIE